MQRRTRIRGLSKMDIFRGAVVLLAVLAWSIPVRCDEIHDAVRKGDLEKVKALLKDNPALVSSKESTGETLLYLAVQTNHKEVAEFLLANGADVNAANNKGNTPLHEAAAGGHKEIAELLLANKADIEAKNTDGYTPLHMAAITGQKEIAEM